MNPDDDDTEADKLEESQETEESAPSSKSEVRRHQKHQHVFSPKAMSNRATISSVHAASFVEQSEPDTLP